MEYEQVAYLVKYAGVIFFFTFLGAVFLYVFWRNNAKTIIGAGLPALSAYLGVAALIFAASKLGNYVLLFVTLALLGCFVVALWYFRSTKDEKYGPIANMPLEDESLIVDQK